MTNQQLKAHCEDVIENQFGHWEDWVVDMARVALASLEAEPVKTKLKFSSVLPKFIGESNEVESYRCMIHGYTPEFTSQTDAYFEAAIMVGDLYTAPPVPELKPIELPEIIHVREPGFIGYVYDANEIEEALKRSGIEVKS